MSPQQADLVYVSNPDKCVCLSCQQFFKKETTLAASHVSLLTFSYIRMLYIYTDVKITAVVSTSFPRPPKLTCSFAAQVHSLQQPCRGAIPEGAVHPLNYQYHFCNCLMLSDSLKRGAARHKIPNVFVCREAVRANFGHSKLCSRPSS